MASGFDWRQIAAAKQQQRQADIDAFVADQDPALTDRITAIDDTVVLARMLAGGELTSEDVTRAYITSLTDVLFSEAIQHARRLDEHLRTRGKPLGPFHGIPVTLKDQFDVKGYDSTLGYTSRASKPASQDGVLTNVPQSIMWGEMDNPLWGRTTNALNAEYTPGGSTGGEAAALYMKGSILGWGTDIGGSIRIPSHMMGLYGLRCSASRLPHWGCAVSTDGQEHSPSSVGPLARSLPTLHHALKETINHEPWQHDHFVSPIPWREDIYNEFSIKKLTIGLFLDDGIVRPHPPVTRVLQKAAAALRAAGHEVIDWPPDLHAEAIELIDELFAVDGGQVIRRDIETGGEPVLPALKGLVYGNEPISLDAYWELNRRKAALRQAHLEKWKSVTSPATGRTVDALLMPVMPHAAVPHGATRWTGYTKVWNLLDYVALAMPAGKVEAEDCEAEWDFEPRNETDEWLGGIWRDRGEEMAELGLPVGVQIVGGRLEEEKVLAVGKVLDDLLRA
ncbi:amidase [Trichoderma citrinoviride]|uniref:Amidase n=1 Tax=Trichoderma citrinoviride TaxID=58853 RepID=A0A2T4BGU8_9HYPO|nr:amidase [Trichoderma citrinoviride]PTB68546.1 amidase [Trichoderma citrinoviride]